ncbi:MAG: phage tail tube protein [Alphaproteobacteria bacterium]|nr:phage tail tube protein [Alphaproteobacteria bacterium]
MPQLNRKRVILAKIESSYGTDPTPTGGSNAILVRGNLTPRPIAAEQVSRELIRSFLANNEQLNANTHVEIDFEVELAGSGALGTAPAYGPLLRACGMSETITASTKVEYQPISASFESVTIYFNNDGVNHKMTGCRGTVSLGINANQIPVYKFHFMGIYNAPTDTALPSPTYTGFKTPQVANNANTTAFTLHSYSGVLQSLDFSLNNQCEFRSLIGGTESILITDRKPSGEIMIEAPALATKDFFAISQADTLGALSITHGSVSGYKVKLDCASVDVGDISYEDSQGITMLRIPFQPIPTSGNDDFKITII